MKKKILITLFSCMILCFGTVSQALADVPGNSTYFTDRFGGADRIETAIELSKDGWEPGNENVIIVRSDNYPDALAAAALGGWLWCPTLLNPTNELDERVEDEIKRLEAENVFIVGGAGAISTAVEEDLEDISGVNDVERIAGDDRYETAAEVAEWLEDDGAGIEQIFICTGENWPDALAASGYAWYYGYFNNHFEGGPDSGLIMPILLVKKKEIPSDTLDWLLSNKEVDTYIIGGEGVVHEDVAEELGDYLEGEIERVEGENRFETCVELAEEEDLWDKDRDNGAEGDTFVFATGLNFPDALAGAFECAHYGNEGPGAPIILTSSIDDSVDDYLDEYFEGFIGFGVILGGKGAVDKDTEDDIADLLSDGDFDPTDDEPDIQSFDVTINEVEGDPESIEDIAQYDLAETLTFRVVVDERIENEDGTVGKVVIEDVSELGGKTAPYEDDDYELPHTTHVGSDWVFENDNVDDGDGINELGERLKIVKKTASPEEREVTFVARAENQAGEDTMESDSIEIYN